MSPVSPPQTECPSPVPPSSPATPRSGGQVGVLAVVLADLLGEFHRWSSGLAADAATCWVEDPKEWAWLAERLALSAEHLRMSHVYVRQVADVFRESG